jgi:hypothetical protein
MPHQPDLFDLVNASEAADAAACLAPPAPAQPRDEGHAAGERCAAAAERRGWDRAEASRLVLAALRQRGPTAGEVLVDLVRAALAPPHDDRAFGAVFGRLARERRIVKAGFAQRRKGHGTAGGVLWRLGPGTLDTE